MFLEKINSPEDLKKLDIKDLYVLAREIREFLIEKVSKTGGHLASNLGVVELTIALHYVFESPKDKFIWDVSHQTYTHKIITGRKDFFENLRKKGGLYGYANPSESIHDIIHAGHSSTSLSIACGLAEALKKKGEKAKVIAIIGDGALTAGLAFEGLNNIGFLKPSNLIIILNDNEMSIARNVGAVAKMLERIRLSNVYINLKREIKSTLEKTKFGKIIGLILYNYKEFLKRILFPKSIFFEELGIKYIGPFDGHNIKELVKIFSMLKYYENGPVLVHIHTRKGKGYPPAEKDPEKFHSAPPFIIETGEIKRLYDKESFSEVFGDEVYKILKEGRRDVILITAAMVYGTGLQRIREEFPENLYDVGIAEQHAVDFAVGLALAGYKPIVAIYSTFLQRAFDQLIHDVGISGLPITFALDRAGVVPEDGETHQGIFDIAYISMIPNIYVVAPASALELRKFLRFAINFGKPIVIRYPKAVVPDFSKYGMDPGEEEIKLEEAVILKEGEDAVIVAVGTLLEKALEIASVLEKEGISISVINPRFLKPIPKNLLNYILSKGKPIYVLEEGIKRGGFGQALASHILESSKNIKIYRIFAIDDVFPKVGKREELLEEFNISVYNITKTIIEDLK